MAAMKFHMKVSADGMLHIPVPGLVPGEEVEVDIQGGSPAQDVTACTFHDKHGYLTDETFIRHPQPELPPARILD